MYKKRAKIKVKGLVQGVNFRYDAKKKADSYDLEGYAKNLETGNEIEIVVEGIEDNVEKMVRWCKTGSDYSRIEDVEVEYEKPTGEYHEFKIEY
jgi:acylphosphatase